MEHKTAAKKIYRMKNEYERLQDEHEAALEKLAMYERREQAEQVLIRANETEGAPEQLKSMSCEGFLSKRAQLEEREDGYLEKAAALVEFSGDGDSFDLSAVPSKSKGSDPADLNGWIASHGA